jgi:hypothetical protein
MRVLKLVNLARQVNRARSWLAAIKLAPTKDAEQHGDLGTGRSSLLVNALRKISLVHDDGFRNIRDGDSWANAVETTVLLKHK